VFWSGDDEEHDDAYAAGAQAFIAKPIDPDPFMRTLKDLLNVRSENSKRST
jgi:hypothetical protein